MNWSSHSTNDDLPVELRERIDRICLEYEDQWRSERTPRVEDYLLQVQEGERAALLHELLLIELDYRERRGESLSASEIRERFPDYPDVVCQIAKRMTIDESPFHSGRRIGRYLIQEKIGEGAFGSVYIGWDEELERTVAIKAPRLDSAGEAERIINEARRVAKLHHPAIVPVYDVVHEEKSGPFIVMEYVLGQTLRERQRSAPLSLPESVSLLARIAEAVDSAHRQGFIHRDLEPSNILIDESGDPHILDFGLALHESKQSLRAGESAGSLAYMSPEQIRGESQWLDGRADIWALGVVLYEMLVGRCPFRGDDVDQLATEIFCREPKPLRQIDSRIPVDLEDICLKCLRKPIAERYATASDLAADLSDILAELESDGSLDDGGVVSREPKRGGWPLVVFGLALVAIVAMAAAAVSQWSGAAPPHTTIDLRVWDAGDRHRSGISLDDPLALPLRPGDQVRLEVSLSKSTYPYVLWIDTRGSTLPVYPWRAGDWSNRGGNETPVRCLSLPTAAGEAWTLEDCPQGMETIVVLTRQSPLPAGFDFHAVVGALSPQTGERYPKVLALRGGELVTGGAAMRAANLGETEPIDDAVLVNQRQIASKTNEFFRTHDAISFPVIGNESHNDD